MLLILYVFHSSTAVECMILVTRFISGTVDDSPAAWSSAVRRERWNTCVYGDSLPRPPLRPGGDVVCQTELPESLVLHRDEMEYAESAADCPHTFPDGTDHGGTRYEVRVNSSSYSSLQ